MRKISYLLVILVVICFASFGLAQSPLTVVIDPGHGGRDSGAVSADGVKEKDVVLSIAKKLAKILTRCGINPILTRSDDHFVALKSRIGFVNQYNPILCVSVHANASKIDSVSGFETYVNNRCSGSRKFLDLLKFANPMLLSSKTRNYKSVQLAYFINEGLSRYIWAKDRGIKESQFYIVRRVKAPCVLVETGFLSNKKEARKLSKIEYQKKIACGLAEGIVTALYGEVGKLRPIIIANRKNLIKVSGENLVRYKN